MSWKPVPRATKADATKMEKKVLRGIRGGNLAAYEVGEGLYFIQESLAFEKLGHSSFDGYLAQLPISRSTALNNIRIYRKFVRDLGLKKAQLAQLSPTKAVILVPVVTPSNVEEWIAKSLQTNEKALRRLVQRALGRYRKVRKKVIFHVWPEDELLVSEVIHLAQSQRMIEHTGDALVDILRRARLRMRGGAA